MSERVGAALRRAVAERAQHRCEYCGMPESEAVVPHEPDHIVATQHGGQTTLENLACACFDCNRIKGSNIASIDPNTGALTPLYNPRTQGWIEHFRWNGPIVEPLTAVGRATAFFLRFNDPVLVEIRANLQRQGRY
jgi:HNH endonuclease